eukprot:4638138-Pleurochrysis_carterae.AAC.1
MYDKPAKKRKKQRKSSIFRERRESSPPPSGSSNDTTPYAEQKTRERYAQLKAEEECERERAAKARVKELALLEEKMERAE